MLKKITPSSNFKNSMRNQWDRVRIFESKNLRIEIDHLPFYLINKKNPKRWIVYFVYFTAGDIEDLLLPSLQLLFPWFCNFLERKSLIARWNQRMAQKTFDDEKIIDNIYKL